MTTIIIDGNNMAHRARYSYTLSFQGQDTSVTFGVMRMLQALLRSHKPRHVIFCWDGGTPNFRKDLVPSYKAGRKDKKDDLDYQSFIHQVQELQEIIPSLGILQAHRIGMEADDLMYHASRMVDGASTIVSGDADMLLAVKEGVNVLKPGKTDVIYTNDNFQELTGVLVWDYLAYKVWQGDGSDNIPGCKGVGPKTSAKIVNGNPLSSKMEQRLRDFQANGYDDASECMDLQYDRVGARQVLLDAEYSKLDA